MFELFEQLLTIAAIYVKSRLTKKCCDLLFISLIRANFTSWQDMFSPYLESFTLGFCAEAPEAKSVN